MFSIENQMHGIPLARSPQEKKHKHMTQIKKRNTRKNEKHIKKENKENKEKRNKRKTKKTKTKNKKNGRQVTVLQFLPNHRYGNYVWKMVPRNHAVAICSDICSHVYGSCCFHMFVVHVERSGAVLRFCSLEVSTHSPLPNSCLEYGGLQCSHIFIIHCVFHCIHSWFISFPGAL